MGPFGRRRDDAGGTRIAPTPPAEVGKTGADSPPSWYGCDIFLFDVDRMLRDGPPPSPRHPKTAPPPLIPSSAASSSRDPAGDAVETASSGSGGDAGRPNSLRSNLTKENTSSDPFLRYEIMSILGHGSMGCVAWVRKTSPLGGGGSDHGGIPPPQPARPPPGRAGTERGVSGAGRGSGAGHQRWHSPPPRPPPGRAGTPPVRPPPGRAGTPPARAGTPPAHPPPGRAGLERGVSGGSRGSRGSQQYENYYALKSIRLDRVASGTSADEIQNEIDMLRRLDHPHIVRAIETFSRGDHIFIVLELCSGGDLYMRDPYTEDEAARIVSSVLSAISYMHSQGVCHRDIKFENILFANCHPMSEVKLVDFGLSKRFAAKDDIMTESVGTIYTMAPYVMRGRYTSQADMWSIGVITFMLLSSTMPFFGQTKEEVIERITRCRYDFRSPRWESVSAQAKQFVSDLLVLDYERRPDAEQALGYLWLNRRHTASVRNPDRGELDAIAESMRRYVEYSKLKKVALMAMAHQSTMAETWILRKVFQQYDASKDGTISLPEFKNALAAHGHEESYLERMFNGINLDGTGNIKYTEFVAASLESLGHVDEGRISEAFRRLDRDESGFICADDLHELLDGDLSPDEIAEMFGGVGVSYQEFLALWDIREEEEDGNADDAAVAEAPTVSFSTSMREMAADGVESSDTEPDDSDDGDDDSAGDSVARANFVKMKKMSTRKFSTTNFQPIIDLGGAERLTERMFRDLSVQEL